MDQTSKQLKHARIAKGVSQEQLAEKLGVNQSVISRVESGNSLTSTETLKKYCQALGLKYDDVLGKQPKIESKAAQALLGKKTTNEGLQLLLLDASLSGSMQITDDEWKLLGSIKLPDTVRKDGYVQLLITLRAIS